MSIDKNSSGFPGIDSHRPTKVNFWLGAEVLLFLAVAAGAAYWIWQKSAAPAAMGEISK
jgi:hypothetical protein